MSSTFKDSAKIIQNERCVINTTPRVNDSINNNRNKSVTTGSRKLCKLLDDQDITASEYVDRALEILKEFYNDFFYDNSYYLPEELLQVNDDIQIPLELGKLTLI